MTAILGISSYYHDSAAALIQDGEIIAAAQEERFTRKKHDPSFPSQSIQYCLDEAGTKLTDLKAVVFYDKPLIKFERLLETYLAYAPKGVFSFISAMPIWLKEKLFLKQTLRRQLREMSTGTLPPLLFSDHHRSHAASAFFPSPFDSAAVLCLDGVGEWCTTSLWLGEKNRLTPQWELHFPHSLGLLYSAFTYYCGFRVNSGEYKLMGLAPYGQPKYVQNILDNLIDLKDDGTFRLNMAMFDFATGSRMTNDKFAAILGLPVRNPESRIDAHYADVAASIQTVAEKIVLQLADTAHNELGSQNLCMAGGVALNCVVNGRLIRESKFEHIWVQPAAGDAGGAVGCALSAWHEHFDNPRSLNPMDGMKGAFLGPSFEIKDIKEFLSETNAPYQEFSDDQLLTEVATLLASGNVVGWFQGRMEFGPRALGARSILGDPRNTTMQKQMNLKIKYRESFRPFAPAVKFDKASEWFEHDSQSPYMLFVAPVDSRHHTNIQPDPSLEGLDLLNIKRSSIPAVTHVDYSARLQTVHPQSNPRFYQLLDKFEQLTGCPVLINTSFNVRGEPIVATPQDAYRCFMRTEIDYLVMENCILNKIDQTRTQETENWRDEFVLD